MPWNENSNGGGPWGQRPGPRGPRPVGGGDGGGGGNFDDLLRRQRERFKGAKSPKLGPGAVVLGVLVLILGWLASGIYQVEPGERGVEQRFGVFTTETTEGLNYHFPWPIERVTIVDVDSERTVDVGRSQAESLMLTGDENIVDFSFRVTWEIKDAVDYVFNLRDPAETVKPVAESVMREVIGRSTLEVIQTVNRPAISLEGRDLIQQTLDDYQTGIRITRVEIQDAKPPGEVQEAFRSVQAAGQEAVTLQNEAQAYANRIVPEARGEAAQITAAANAYREQVVAEAAGQAERFNLIYAEYAKARDVTRRRMYLETMERVLGGMDKVVIDPSAGGGSGVVPYLPLPEVRDRARRGASGDNQGG